MDLTDEKGYFCGKILGDLGADVIKIEKPGGDPGRNIGPFYKDIIDPEKSLYWMFFNTSKRGITLDIETADGREIFKRLAKTADFVIESFPPGYMDSLGLGYEALNEINPQIIMTSITPFGQTGPYRDFKSSDIVVWAMGSSMAYTGKADRPVRVGVPQASILGGLHAAAGSMLAHYHREVTGEGQHVDVSMQQACISSWFPAVEIWHLLRLIMPRAEEYGAFGRPQPMGTIKTRYIWPCKDGHVCMHLLGGANVGQAKSSTELVKWAVSEGMALELKDYDWSKYDGSTITQEERERLENIIIPFLLTKTKEELYEAAREKGILLLPSNNVKDVLESPQLAARQFWIELKHPELGDTITYPGGFLKLSECPLQISRRAPLIGEHNDEIYGKELGFTKEKLAILKHARVI
ncbi:MAG TPA: CoA transferase [Dehalococcoidia bacterium]|nr:CoA transferase [Dehalococcoidia bacterium]